MEHPLISGLDSLTEDVGIKFNPKPFTRISDIKGYCVYGYLRESDDEFGPANSIRYIGEGLPDRPIASHDIHNIRVPHYTHIIIFADNLDKDTAVSGERALIQHYGRIVSGEGILENIKKSNGWGTAGVNYEKVLCKFCLTEFAKTQVNRHEQSCKENPNSKPGMNFGCVQKKKQCQYCLSSFTRIHLHEISCDKNPNKESVFGLSKCQYCKQDTSTKFLHRHEKSCILNPNRVNKIHDKKSCQYCSVNYPVNVIKQHEKCCQVNPNRVDHHNKRK